VPDPNATFAVPLDGWRAVSSDRSEASVGASATAPLSFAFTLVGPGSWAIARRDIAFPLPDHFVFVLELRGATTAPAELQLKLIDPSGANVWWWRRPQWTPPEQRTRLVLRRAGLAFAWGPASGGMPKEVAAIELAVASDAPASGTLELFWLAAESRGGDGSQPRVSAIAASSSAADRAPGHAIDDDDATAWAPALGDAAPWLTLDLGHVCEFGGVAIDWAPGQDAPAARLLTSDDGEAWTWLATSPAGRGGRRTWLRTGEGEGRFAKVELHGTAAIARIAPVSLEAALAPVRHVAALARVAPLGHYPRHLLDESTPWALVSSDGGEQKGLLGGEGAFELGVESPTIEPFCWCDGRLFSWADANARASLAAGSLPIPTVDWHPGPFRLAITAFAATPPTPEALLVRYELENTSNAAKRLRLVLALRPFQVTPGWQSLNLRGGISPVTRIDRAGLLHGDRSHEIVAVTAPDAFVRVRSEDAPIAPRLGGAFAPGPDEIDDPLGLAEAALVYECTLAPGQRDVIAVAVPSAIGHSDLPRLSRAAATAWIDERLAAATDAWRDRLAAIPIALPPVAEAVAQSLRASVAWVLALRDGPRLQPGARCYRRSWIRDGALTATALAELGFAEEAKAFLRWYAPYQLADGRVPCAVDRNGIDLAVEHDSHGQLVFGIVETARLTSDRAFLTEHWPRVVAAVGALERLRATQLGDELRGGPRYGLLPESISHEGYASHPVHSYWDDAFALRAFADAEWAGGELGDEPMRTRAAALGKAMRADFAASVKRAIAQHGIDYVPGSVELGDFDPTSTAIAFDPCGVASLLPARPLARGFDRWLAELASRERVGAEAYSPYEVRNATALLALGRRERALALVDALIADQRPRAWRQWPEVAWRDRRAPRFLGDLPHGWVASTFLRVVRRLLVFEREDDSLWLCAGVPEAWVRDPAGVRAAGLATRFGTLDLHVRADDAKAVLVSLGGSCARPPGGIAIASPFATPITSVVADGRPHEQFDDEEARFRDLPREIVLRY
jgi:hypothetical protein